MERTLTVAVVAKAHDAHKDEKSLALKRELGLALASASLPVFSHFSPTLTYVKEAFLSQQGNLVSLSPACSEEEHISIFRFHNVAGEMVLYTGLGKHLTLLSLLRSVSLVICTDEASFEEMTAMKEEKHEAEVILLTEEVITQIKTGNLAK